jgi:hypothetical protein
MRALGTTMAGLVVLMLSGCGDVSPPSRPPLAPPGIAIPTPDQPTAAQPAAQPAAKPGAGAMASGFANLPLTSPVVTPPAVPASPQPAGQPQALPPPAPGEERVVAKVGVGQKGHYAKGLITTPLSAIFRTREKLAFEVQVKHSLDLYKAQSPDGRGPATHEEFMQKIVKDNQIKLPELPPEHRYLYDPKEEKLMVERPVDSEP